MKRKRIRLELRPVESDYTPRYPRSLDPADYRALLERDTHARTRRVAALTSFRSLVERTFLPLMLLDPGIALGYLEEESDDVTASLTVRLAGRNMNLATDIDTAGIWPEIGR